MVKAGDTVRVVRHPYVEGTLDKGATYKVDEVIGGALYLDDKRAFPLYVDEVEVAESSAPKFAVGQRVKIIRDSAVHGFGVGDEVYLLGKDGPEKPLWLASKDRGASPEWTGRAFATNMYTVVMYVPESDIEPLGEVPVAEWEKELLADTDESPWLDVVEGSKVTIKYLPTGEVFTTTVHQSEWDSLAVLGWSFDQGENPRFEEIELLSVEHVKPVLPTEHGSIIDKRTEGEFVLATDDHWVRLSDGYHVIYNSSLGEDFIVKRIGQKR